MMIVYAILSENGAVKVGVSKSVDKRVVDLGREGFGLCSLHFSTSPLENARMVENISHDILRPHRIKGEWFNVTPEQAVDAISRSIEMANSGLIAATKDNRTKQRAMCEREKARGLIRRTVSIPIERIEEQKKLVAEWMRIHQEESRE